MDSSNNNLNNDDDLTKRFRNGLKRLNITEEELIDDYFYIGGDFSHHLKLYQKHNIKPLPPKNHRCICGHKIRNNIFISNGENILSLGSSCFQKFCPKTVKLCEDCGYKHRNRKDNICNKCRKKFTKKVEYIILKFD